MILTKCAACAAPMTHDAPRCMRCLTRYCSSTCQHDHFGLNDPTDIGAMQRLIDERMVSMPRNATPEQQYLAFQYDRTREFVSILAARGLPPDWTEEELERQGYDLWATRPEDVYTGPPPVPDPWRGDGRGVAAAMLAQMADAGVEVPAGLASSYGLS